MYMSELQASWLDSELLLLGLREDALLMSVGFLPHTKMIGVL